VIVRPVQSGRHRLVDDYVRVSRLLGNALDRMLENLALVLPHRRIVVLGSATSRDDGGPRIFGTASVDRDPIDTRHP
jgi:hypothetical protein